MGNDTGTYSDKLGGVLIAGTASALILVNTCLLPRQETYANTEKNHQIETGIFGTYDWEKKIRGSASTGGYVFIAPKDEPLEELQKFASKILLEIKDFPSEYEEAFQQNFEDLLA